MNNTVSSHFFNIFILNHLIHQIADHLPFGAGVLLDCVLKRFERKGAALVELNRRAFEAGRAAVGEAEAALA